MEAAQAFEAALAGEGRTRSDAAYGQSLAYLRAGLTADAAVAATRAELDGCRTAELQTAILTDRAVASFRARPDGPATSSTPVRSPGSTGRWSSSSVAYAARETGR